ncbi:basic proline-rich protein-like [Melopsittacus undulatus]|uniref:basic proline-rich protein-like n=1 Tax=Melopsittacus undulatus TaxID=13146 RepID=UPI00146F52F6|nr:basic proline-rich protein-like [Melopsittacus undulatus]
MIPMAFPGPCGFSGSEAPQRAETGSSCLSDPQVKDEDKSLAVKRPGKEDGASESPKDAAPAPPNPEPPRSPEPPPAQGTSPEPVLNGAAMNGLEGPAPEAQGDDGQGLSRRRVVRVVRKVVRKVLPGEDTGSAKEPARDAKGPEPVPPPRKEEMGRAPIPAPPAPPPPPPVPAAPAKPEPKDEISAGLKTLMAKGKTKEHRTRLRPGDRQERSPEPTGGDVKPSLSPGAEAKLEPLGHPSAGRAEPAKASALKPTALERHKVPVCAVRDALTQLCGVVLPMV